MRHSAITLRKEAFVLYYVEMKGLLLHLRQKILLLVRGCLLQAGKEVQ